MHSRKSNHVASSWIIRILIPLLDSDLIGKTATVVRLARRIFTAKVHEGLYEVLNYDALLDLRDEKGKIAVYKKCVKVRFLQNNIIAFQDQAWGEGEIFDDYKVSPGKAVDRYREGNRFRVLISLHETKKRGDIEEFNIQRTIKQGFTSGVEDFQVDINHPTKEISVRLVFPKTRLPKEVTLLEKNAARSTRLGPENRRVLPDDRLEVTWRAKKPRLYEAYILRWKW